MPTTAYRSGVRPTERSLTEQLKINDREIQSRKDLLDFTAEDEALLRALQAIVVEKLDAIVDAFYDQQLSNNDIALIIGDAETLQRLRGAMRGYILELFEGYYDGEYVNKRLRIGKVHQRIGVSPKLYVAALNLLQSTLDAFVVENSGLKTDETARNRQREALRKLLMFDMQLVFDTYISSLVMEVETARRELAEYAEGLEETIAERTRQLQEMSIRDSLTGLFNQRGFYDNLRRELAVAERTRQPLTLIYFDLNGFKALNDSKGHREGDRLLTQVGAAITKELRDVDFGCRYGGDEFAVIMPRTDLASARKVYGRIVDAFEEGKTAEVTFSTGIIQTGPEDHLHMDQLVHKADAFMYLAKARSKENPGHHIHPQ